MTLKPCPFCNGEAQRDIVGQVECIGCGVMKFDDEAWNMRHYPKEVKDVLEAVKALVMNSDNFDVDAFIISLGKVQDAFKRMEVIDE